MSNVQLGRLPRGHDPRIPHLSALVAGQTLAPPPASIDWTVGMPAALGEMLNDQLNDCSCAAYYHALQVWTHNVGPVMQTAPDSDVRMLYSAACGYDPETPGTGPCGNEQQVLTYIHRTGAPVGANGQTRNKIAAFIEIDPRNIDDIKRAIVDCGVAYIGFKVPQYIVPAAPATTPALWDVQTANAALIGGHAVVLAGYDADGARVISWGQYYKMTWAFFTQFVDEAYALVDASWVGAKGTTPGGLSLAALAAQMKPLAEG